MEVGSNSDSSLTTRQDKVHFSALQNGYLALAIEKSLTTGFLNLIKKNYSELSGNNIISRDTLKQKLQELVQTGGLKANSDNALMNLIVNGTCNNNSHGGSPNKKRTQICSTSTAQEICTPKTNHSKHKRIKLRGKRGESVSWSSSDDEFDSLMHLHDDKRTTRTKRKPWSDKEVAVLIDAVKTHGKKWSYIATHYRKEFNQRTPVNIKDKCRWLEEKELL